MTSEGTDQENIFTANITNKELEFRIKKNDKSVRKTSHPK